MRERLVVAAILTFGPYLTLWASAPQQVDEAKARHLQLKSTPKCTEDPEDATLSEALNWARSDLAISLLLKVTPSGTVDEIRILDYSPSGNALAERFANSLARCWRSAVYDTQALKSSEFPAYTRVNVTYKAARDQNGKLKN